MPGMASTPLNEVGVDVSVKFEGRYLVAPGHTAMTSQHAYSAASNSWSWARSLGGRRHPSLPRTRSRARQWGFRNSASAGIQVWRLPMVRGLKEEIGLSLKMQRAVVCYTPLTSLTNSTHFTGLRQIRQLNRQSTDPILRAERDWRLRLGTIGINAEACDFGEPHQVGRAHLLQIIGLRWKVTLRHRTKAMLPFAMRVTDSTDPAGYLCSPSRLKGPQVAGVG